jgi:hypothetical protein
VFTWPTPLPSAFNQNSPRARTTEPYSQRHKKLLEGAAAKFSSAVHSLAKTKTARDILEALARVKSGRAAEQVLDGMIPAVIISG